MPQPLASTLDTAAAGQLRLTLKEAIGRGTAVVLDGAGVERVGQACLQVLLAARATAAAAGIGFRITAPSAPLEEMVRLARLDAILDPVLDPVRDAA